MLFFVSPCRRKAIKRPARGRRALLRVLALFLAGILAVTLLLLAPQWLLVLLIILLTAALVIAFSSR